MLVLGLHIKDRKDKANISNPKVNRGCPPLTANCTSADCVQISLGSSLQYIPLRVYRTGGFNAMIMYSKIFFFSVIKKITLVGYHYKNESNISCSGGLKIWLIYPLVVDSWVITSLVNSDAIWRHSLLPTLDQVMSYCLTASLEMLMNLIHNMCLDINYTLTHWVLVTPYGVGDLGQHWFR